ncbi:MAG: SsrA-binding protein SmpB [Desulfobacterota bacterium]|jgi:SsrA-binding protein|nr:SsrA-binding protein SmpB [Thermodesulfobacteriota bacterium]
MAENIKIVCTNRKARHDYHVEEVIETGIVLTGPEVKSLRLGRANLKDSYAQVKGGEIFLLQTHISPYENAPLAEQQPTRMRKLMLHGREIKRLMGKVQEKGLTLVPLKLYFRNGKVKVELALVKGKKQYDKRETIRKRDEERDMQRAIREKK